ncbi:MAG: division/cell wall cluster transcriptional repressor MraZ [Deltaproteobacteria bacterium]|nr:division/cell wall cluster transcriptional repressor MraZ [Deltaproteobacteria bacterium]
MFRGRFEHTIDAKGRISLPAKYREILSTNYDDRLIVTNFDSCLVAYPYEEWVVLEERFSQHSIMEDDVQTFIHYFISGATECSIDKLGRMLIPPNLRKHANLEKEVVFVGMITRIQIWDKGRWDQKFMEAQEKFNQIKGKETLAKLGF